MCVGRSLYPRRLCLAGLCLRVGRCRSQTFWQTPVVSLLLLHVVEAFPLKHNIR